MLIILPVFDTMHCAVLCFGVKENVSKLNRYCPGRELPAPCLSFYGFSVYMVRV